MSSPPQVPPASTRVQATAETEKAQADTTAAAAAGGLEASLLQLIQNHQHSSLKLREQTERAKRESVRHAKRVSDLLTDALNGGVQESYVIEKRIELEIRTLAATIAKFMKQTDQWLATSHAINTAVKEIGDFENWMKTMDLDCKSINAAIRNIYQD
ncbi:hypothetical protein WN944_009927 [Citrus x changshan-huyou]|uniref:Biogenesis of lysosome-related organelles complex 1 subunit 1 n=1 Tax=Citrus x changshan-huyou TaxID=2935761 RepID=A0AAP0QXD2_9ROSI